jgi:hypothetical protein
MPPNGFSLSGPAFATSNEHPDPPFPRTRPDSGHRTALKCSVDVGPRDQRPASNRPLQIL